MNLGVNDLLALNNLLTEQHEEPSYTSSAITPASFGGQPQRKQETGPPKKVKDPKAIWDEDEVPPEDAILVEDTHDKRPRPKYNILYKQLVGSEDVFLGLGDKTPGSTDCSHMTVKVDFPGHTMKDLDLDVSKHKLRAESNKMLLSIFLPLPVDSDHGSAKWDAKKEQLIVTLPIIRDEW
jgi:dynein assembly factor 6, axonemal